MAALPSIDYWFVERRRRIHKTVDYFLLEFVGGSADDFDPQEVSGARWFPWEEAITRLTFDNERGVAAAAQRLWRERTAAPAGAAGPAAGEAVR